MLVLQLLSYLLMRKSAQNNSSNGGPDATIGVTIHGGLNVAFESAP